MRTYKSSTNGTAKTRRRIPARGLTAIIVSAAVVLIAAALTLALTFGLRAPVAEEGVQTVAPPPEDEVKPLVFSAPLNECNVTKNAALDRLVYNDTLKQWRTHNGVDFEAAAGSEVFCVAEGTVTSVEDTILDGVVVTVSHRDGYVSTYKGLGQSAVTKGDSVSGGTKLGVVGNMMCEQNSGAHLHLEMKKDGKLVSVTEYIDVNENK